VTRLSRRSVLRAGGSLAVATTIAGCTGSSDSGSTNGGIPGVEDGEVVDSHAFATAHSDQLAARSGLLEWARVSLDPETGGPETHSVWTVRVEGDRLHAVVTGRAVFSGTGQDRQEFYYGEEGAFYRGRTDGEWETGPLDRQGIPRGEFTGRSELEVVSLRREGTETIDGEELYRFSNVQRSTEDGQSEWVNIQAFVDEDALVHAFQQTVDSESANSRRFDEWHVTALDATTVERPEWVDEVDV